MAIIDTHLATKKIKIRRIDSKDIFLSTIWKGEIVMGFFDTTTCKISQLTCFRCIDSEEVKQLENVITNYIFSGSRKNLV